MKIDEIITSTYYLDVLYSVNGKTWEPFSVLSFISIAHMRFCKYDKKIFYCHKDRYVDIDTLTSFEKALYNIDI